MTKVFIIGYANLIEQSKRIIKEISFPPHIDVNYLLAEQLLNYEIIINQEDILICGERSEDRLNKLGLNATIVPIKMNTHDFQKAIITAYEHEPGKQVKVVVFGQKYTGIEFIQDYLKLQFEQNVFDNDEDIEAYIRELRNQGYKTVVGASYVGEVAQKYGMMGISLFSENSIRAAIIHTADLINIKKIEYERIEQLKAVTSYTYGAILSIDNNNKITVYNSLSEQLLGIPASEALYQSIEKVITDQELLSIFQTNEPIINQIINFNYKKIVITSIPIIVSGEVQGTVSTFHDTSSIQKTEQKIRMRQHNKKLNARYKFNDIIGNSSILKKVKKTAMSYAESNSTILILGETGTGKELFAQSIHNHSTRNKGPFVAINCAALPESLLNSELFGYVGGAFTGARQGGKPGLFELAHDGTIFLDEIGDISLSIQSKLLRVIQERELMRVGGENIIPINVRVICATNKNLAQSLKKETFRKDFYYRISVLQLKIPPLRQRIEDLLPLIEYFFKIHDHELLISLKPILPNICKVLTNKRWEGNVRELENTIERFIIMFKHQKSFSKDEILNLLKEAAEIDSLYKNSDTIKEKPNKETETDLDVNKEVIESTINYFNGNKSAAAKSLGISRVTLYRKLNKEKV